MEDLEEELLQVAGRSKGAGSKKRSRAASDDEGSLDLGSDEDDMPRKGKGGSKGRGSQAAGRKKQARGSRAAAESEEEEEADDDDSDALYEDEEDRRRLEAMTELEREMILADRAIARDEARQRRQLLQKAGKLEQKGPRQSSRQKAASADKDTAIKQLAAARKKRKNESEDEEEEEVEEEEEEAEWEDDDDEGDEEAAPATRRVTRAAASTAAGTAHDEALRRLPDEYEDEDEALRGVGVRRQAFEAADEDMGPSQPAVGGVGEVGMDEGHGEDDENADPHELRAIQLTRSQLEAMYDKPFFEGDGLAGALVRMAYGAPSRDRDGNQVPTYWMMQIVSIKETSKSYPFGPRQAPCYKHLELRDGARIVRTLPMSNVSNQQLEDGEIERFARHAGRVQDRPISKQQALEVRNRVQEAINYRWDAAKVKEVLARKREAGYVPVNAAQEKSRLKRLLEEAKSKPEKDKDYDAIQQMESQLVALEEREKARAAEMKNAMSIINQRNKDANFSQTIRNVGNKPNIANAPERKGGADPFSRRVTRPNIYWSTGQGKGASAKEDGTKANGSAQEKSAVSKGGAGAGGVPAAAAKLQGSLARMDPTQLVKMLDIDIDTLQLQDCSVVPPLHLRLLGPRWHQSLARYAQADLSGKTLLTPHDWQTRAASNNM